MNLFCQLNLGKVFNKGDQHVGLAWHGHLKLQKLASCFRAGPEAWETGRIPM